MRVLSSDEARKSRLHSVEGLRRPADIIGTRFRQWLDGLASAESSAARPGRRMGLAMRLLRRHRFTASVVAVTASETRDCVFQKGFGIVLR